MSFVSNKIPRLNLLPAKPVKAKKLKKRKTLARYLNRALLHSRFGLVFGIVNLCLLIALGSIIWRHNRSLQHYQGLVQDLTRQKDLLQKELGAVKTDLIHRNQDLRTDLTHTNEDLRTDLTQLDARSAKNQANMNDKLTTMAAGISRLEKRRYYLVKDGETLEEISEKLYGDPGNAKLIMRLNQLENGAEIKTGDILVIEK